MANEEQKVTTNTNGNKRKTVGKILFRVGVVGSIVSAFLLFSLNYIGAEGNLDFGNSLFFFVLALVCILVFIISLPMIVIGVELRRERHAGTPNEQQPPVNTRGNKGKNSGRVLFWVGFIGFLISLMVLMAHPADEDYIGEAFIGIGGCLITLPILLIGLALIIKRR